MKSRFILSKKKVLEQYNKIKEVCDEVAYSYKTNPEVGDVLQEITDSSFSISSFASAFRIKNPEKIIYFLQGETEEIKELIKYGIRRFVVDNKNDLENILSYIQESNEKFELSLRTKVREHTIYTGKYFVYGFKWRKTNELLKELQEIKNIELGVHFHRKTQNVGEWFLKDDFEEIFDDESRKIMKHVNIGGGIPWIYVNSKPNIDLILNKIKEFHEYLRERNIKLITEPGRFIAAPAVRLETEIINIYDDVIVVDASLFNGALDIYLLGYRFPVVNEKEKGFRYLIKGRSPDSLDIFRYKVFFEKKPRIGDKIIFESAGAYNFYTNFDFLPKIKTIIKEDF